MKVTTWQCPLWCLIACTGYSIVFRSELKFCFYLYIEGLFVDVGNNYSVLDNPNICFVYDYVGSKDSDREQSQYVSTCMKLSPLLTNRPYCTSMSLCHICAACSVLDILLILQFDFIVICMLESVMIIMLLFHSRIVYLGFCVEWY